MGKNEFYELEGWMNTCRNTGWGRLKWVDLDTCHLLPQMSPSPLPPPCLHHGCTQVFSSSRRAPPAPLYVNMVPNVEWQRHEIQIREDSRDMGKVSLKAKTMSRMAHFFPSSMRSHNVSALGVPACGRTA